MASVTATSMAAPVSVGGTVTSMPAMLPFSMGTIGCVSPGGADQLGVRLLVWCCHR